MATINGKIHVVHNAVQIVVPLPDIVREGYWLYLFNMETDTDKPIFLGGLDVQKNQGIVLPSGPWVSRVPFAIYVQADESIYAVCDGPNNKAWMTYLYQTVN